MMGVNAAVDALSAIHNACISCNREVAGITLILSCASSRATLKLGIESAIRRVALQVRHIVDATDHTAGVNPYYK